MLEYRAYEQIESYLKGDMPAEERAGFEALLRTDARLAEQVREHRHLLQAMRSFGQRQALKQQLNRIHADLEPETETAVASPAGWKVFRNRHFQTIAVAASVSLVSVFGTLWSVQQLKAPVRQQTARYIELRREVERLKKPRPPSSTASMTLPGLLRARPRSAAPALPSVLTVSLLPAHTWWRALTLC